MLISMTIILQLILRFNFEEKTLIRLSVSSELQN